MLDGARIGRLEKLLILTTIINDTTCDVVADALGKQFSTLHKGERNGIEYVNHRGHDRRKYLRGGRFKRGGFLADRRGYAGIDEKAAPAVESGPDAGLYDYRDPHEVEDEPTAYAGSQESKWWYDDQADCEEAYEDEEKDLPEPEK